MPQPSISILYTGTRAPTITDPRLVLHHVPMLEAAPVDFDIPALLQHLAGPCTLVFYSRHSARIMCDSGVFQGTDLARHQLWAVGQQTADVLRRELGVDVRVPARENFEGLTEALADARTDAALGETLVAFSLLDSPRDLSPVTAPSGVAFVDIPVYETRARSTEVMGDIMNLLDAARPQWLVFTSPRGFETFARLVEHPEQPETFSWRTAKIAAIGPTTAGAIQAASITPEIVMDVPDRNLMIQVILDASI